MSLFFQTYFSLWISHELFDWFKYLLFVVHCLNCLITGATWYSFPSQSRLVTLKPQRAFQNKHANIPRVNTFQWTVTIFSLSNHYFSLIRIANEDCERELMEILFQWTPALIIRKQRFLHVWFSSFNVKSRLLPNSVHSNNQSDGNNLLSTWIFIIPVFDSIDLLGGEQ